MYYNNEPTNIGSMTGMSPAVKFLLIINISLFLLERVLHIPFSNWFLLHPDWWNTLGFAQLFTYMFIHGSVTHLFLNMLTLYFIGPTVERTIGSYRFFILFYLSGILGGLGWSLLADPLGPPCVGASGGIMGIIGAFGALYPNARLLLWFIIPVRAWVLVSLLAIWELHETISDPVFGGIANAAHLVGGIAGFSYAASLKYPHIIKAIREKIPFIKDKPGAGYAKKTGAKYTKPGPRSRPETLSKEDVDRILDKIGKEGMGALTPREREMLRRATRG